MSCWAVMRGWLVKEVPNRIRLTIDDSSPCLTRARVDASAAAIQVFQPDAAGGVSPGAAKTGSACAFDR